MNLTNALIAGSLLALLVPLPIVAQTADAVARRYPDHARLMHYVDAQGREHPVGDRNDWKHRRAHILLGMQAAMGPLPDRGQLPAVDIKYTPEKLSGQGFVRETLTFPMDAGDRVPADLYLPMPRPADQKLPAMLALHLIGALGKRILAGEGPRLNRQ